MSFDTKNKGKYCQQILKLNLWFVLNTSNEMESWDVYFMCKLHMSKISERFQQHYTASFPINYPYLDIITKFGFTMYYNTHGT